MALSRTLIRSPAAIGAVAVHVAVGLPDCSKAGSLRSWVFAGREGGGLVGVACVVALGAGDVGVASQSQEADEQVAADGQGVGAGSGSGLVGVFAGGDVADPVETVLDFSVASQPAGQLAWLGLGGAQRADRVDALGAPLGPLVGARRDGPGRAHDLDPLGGVGEP